jgi:hypothetical protein
MEAILDLTELEIDGHSVAMIAPSPRSGNNRFFPILSSSPAQKVYASWAVNVPTLMQMDFRLDGLGPTFPIDDMYLHLSLLRAGYTSVRINCFTWDQVTSNQTGGCTSVRKNGGHNEQIMLLNRTFPDFTKVVDKEAKTWGSLDVRKDLHYQWKKALSPATPKLATY